jgi:hypothetical protein
MNQRNVLPRSTISVARLFLFQLPTGKISSIIDVSSFFKQVIPLFHDDISISPGAFGVTTPFLTRLKNLILIAGALFFFLLSPPFTPAVTVELLFSPGQILLQFLLLFTTIGLIHLLFIATSMIKRSGRFLNTG